MRVSPHYQSPWISSSDVLRYLFISLLTADVGFPSDALEPLTAVELHEGQQVSSDVTSVLPVSLKRSSIGDGDLLVELLNMSSPVSQQLGHRDAVDLTRLSRIVAWST